MNLYIYFKLVIFVTIHIISIIYLINILGFIISFLFFLLAHSESRWKHLLKYKGGLLQTNAFKGIITDIVIKQSTLMLLEKIYIFLNRTNMNSDKIIFELRYFNLDSWVYFYEKNIFNLFFKIFYICSTIIMDFLIIIYTSQTFFN